MASPLNPIQSATKSLATAQKALDKIFVATGANGKFVKVGSVTRTDLEDVASDLTSICEMASDLVTSCENILDGISEAPTTKSSAGTTPITLERPNF